ncbi:hypothetical protein BT096_11980, partial [Corynebacterium diphtheriae]
MCIRDRYYFYRDAIAHGKISEKPLRERPQLPTWALKLGKAVTGPVSYTHMTLPPILRVKITVVVVFFFFF